MKIQPTRIIIVDHNEVTRKGLEHIIDEAGESYRVVATLAQLDELVRFVENHSIEIVLIDDKVFDPHEIVRVISRYHDTQPGIGIVVLSHRRNGEYIRQIMRYGSMGFILNEGKVSEKILTAVRLVGEKYPFISSEAACLLDTQLPHCLGYRDQEVLRLLEGELSVKEIAVRLALTDSTIYRVRSKLKQVLGVRNNENIVDAARKSGLLDPQ